MDPVSHPCDKVPIPVDLDAGINHTKDKGSCQELAKENFTLVEEEVNWNHNHHVTYPSSLSLKPKTQDFLNLNDCKKVQPFVKSLFKETRETFPIIESINIF